MLPYQAEVPSQRDAILDRERGLHRSLSTGQLSMIAIGGAIGTGLFLGSGMAIRDAGPAVILSYTIGGLIALLLMGCLAEMTVAHPASGSFGVWAECYVGPMAGFLVRYEYWSCLVFGLGTEVSAIAVYMRYWYPQVPGWVWIAGFAAALIAVNAFSVELFGSVEYCFSALKVTAILAFILLGSWLVSARIGFANFTTQGGFAPMGVWKAVLVSIFSYLSIEMIAVAAGEARDPAVAVPRAFRATIFRLTFFYLLTLALIVAMAPWTAASTGESPFVQVMAVTHLPGAAGIINFVILIAALSAMNSQLYSTTRMMFSLSRAGYSPRSLGELNKRGVPVAALLVSTGGIALAALLSVVYPEAAFATMMAISMFGAMFTWLMIFVTHIFFRRAHQGEERPIFRMWGYPYTAAAGAALMAALLVTTAFTTEFRMTLVCGAPFLILLMLMFKAQSRRLPS